MSAEKDGTASVERGHFSQDSFHWLHDPMFYKPTTRKARQVNFVTICRGRYFVLCRDETIEQKVQTE